MLHEVLIINANPLLNLVHTGPFTAGAINRVDALAMHAEGKGVNVARVLSRLGHTVLLTGFAGGYSGAWLRHLVRQEKGVHDAFIETAAPLRVGFMASPPSHDHPTTLLPNGFPVTRQECQTLLQQIQACLDNVRLVIISGSVPDITANDLYREILELSHARGKPCWLDAHGPALTNALSCNSPPSLAKPNRDEFSQSQNWEHVPELHITDGGGPIEIRHIKHGRWRVHPPAIRQVNPVGSGDCYLAGLASGWLAGQSLEERLQMACAAGAANTRQQEVAMIEKADVLDLLGGAHLERLG